MVAAPAGSSAAALMALASVVPRAAAAGSSCLSSHTLSSSRQGGKAWQAGARLPCPDIPGRAHKLGQQQPEQEGLKAGEKLPRAPSGLPGPELALGGGVLVGVLVGSEFKPNVAAALFKVRLLSTFRTENAFSRF